MRKRFFLASLVKLLAISLLPILAFSAVYLFFAIPEQRDGVRRNAASNLALISENLTLLLNDSEKALNMLESGNVFGVIRGILQDTTMDYGQYLNYKAIVSQMAAVANSREYVDSMYVYVPNRESRYLTDQGRILALGGAPDPGWYAAVAALDVAGAPRLVRRQAQRYAFENAESAFLTILEKNARGGVVAVNIQEAYFRRIFDAMSLFPGQTLMVVGGGELLVSSGGRDAALALLGNLRDASDASPVAEERGMLVVRSYQEPLGLTFVSAVPESVAFASVNRFIGIMALVGALCFAVSVVLAFLEAARTARRLYGILDMMEAASNRRPLPPVQRPRNDVYGAILTNIVHTFLQNDYLKVLLDERKFQAISLELSALQYQINPHFLSNTLQIIDFEVLRETRSFGKANEMIGQLSQFLQYSLKSPSEDVTVAMETDATALYVELMKARFGGKICVQWRVDADARPYRVPKLILQPVIENSMQHGLGGARDTLTITVSIEQKEGGLTIEVADDGEGATAAQIAEIRRSLPNFQGFEEKHIGLRNLFRRLQLRYDGRCRVEIDSPGGRGFTVRLFIPAPES